MKTLIAQIEATKTELAHTKPRSRRRIELETRLRDLMVQQIRRENRVKTRKAA